LHKVDEEVRQSRSIRVKPSILRKAHHYAIESRQSIGKWIEEAMEEKIEREKQSTLNRKTFDNTSFGGE